MTDPLVIERELACSPDHAFASWTGNAAHWWPSDHTRSGLPGTTVVYEAHTGGRVFERAPDGTEIDWGRITTWDPPHRVAYSWHLSSSVEQATHVTVTFDGNPNGTTMRLEHRGWEQFGKEEASRRDANHNGWSEVLGIYLRAVSSSA